MKVTGIDVSKHQGSINWSYVKSAGIGFAILRAGYGRAVSQKDVRFDEYYENCKAHGIPCGAYWYSYCDSVEDAVREAKACLEVIKGKTFEYPIYFDVEEKSQFSKGKQFCSDIVKAFCNTLEEAGYFAGLYMSRSPLNDYITPEVRNRYALWIAEYNDQCHYSGDYGMWQKASTGVVAGIAGNVDVDECYVDYPSIIKKAGLNGFPKQTTETKPVEKTEPAKTEPAKPEYISYTVKKNDTLWDIAAKYLGNGTRYKEIMKASGITSETIYPKQVLKIKVN